MLLEEALRRWLVQQTDLECYWFEREASAHTCIVYRCITPGIIDDGDLVISGLSDDRYSITIYHTSADAGKHLANQLVKALNGFTGSMSGLQIQAVDFLSGFDRHIPDATLTTYQFNRDFSFKY